MADSIQVQKEKLQAQIDQLSSVADKYNNEIRPQLVQSKEDIISNLTSAAADILRDEIEKTGIFTEYNLNPKDYIRLGNRFHDFRSFHINLLVESDPHVRHFSNEISTLTILNDDTPIIELDNTSVYSTHYSGNAADESKEILTNSYCKKLVSIEIIKYLIKIEHLFLIDKESEAPLFIKELRLMNEKFKSQSEVIDSQMEKYDAIETKVLSLKSELKSTVDKAIIQAIYTNKGIKFKETIRLTIKPSGDYYDNRKYTNEIRLGKETDKSLTIEFWNEEAGRTVGSYRQDIKSSVQTLVNYWKKYSIREDVSSPIIDDVLPQNNWHHLDEGSYY